MGRLHAALDRLHKGGRSLRAGLSDGAHAAVYLRQLLRGNFARRDVRTDGRQGPPVILVHGFLATRGSLHLLACHLEDRGRRVLMFRLGPANLGDIRASAARIAAHIESVAAQTGVAEVDLVGHSMGGLTALYYVKRLAPPGRVRRLVLLGSPARGTLVALGGLPAALLGLGPLQLLPGSAFLAELAEGPIPHGVQVTVIAGERDWLAPLRSTALAGAETVTLPTGHSGLLVDEASADAVVQALG